MWQAVVDLDPKCDVADSCFYYGAALAHLGRWAEAKAAFETGRRAFSHDARFPVELAGVAFKEKKYAEAQSWLQQALRLSPDDTYANDFLGTVFFLQGNLDAALKYWNRIGKPHIQAVVAEPVPRLDSVLLDHAFAFSPASTLNLADVRTSEARIDQLNVFATASFDLQALPSGNFDLAFRNIERNGCGGNRWACLLDVLGNTPAQIVRFDYSNIRHRAENLDLLYRWDGEKRRVLGDFEMPLRANPRWGLRFRADVRDENWAIRNSFSGPAPVLSAFKMKRQSAAVRFADVMSGRWSWAAEAEISHRSYGKVLQGILTPALLDDGTELKQSISARANLLYLPERRFAIDADGTAAVSRLWGSTGRNFSQIAGGIRLHWFPQHTGQLYEIQESVRAGRTFGDPTFDEFGILGVLGDTDLLMRAHIATRDGKKGSAPLGRNYFLSNWDATRDVSPFALVKIKVGPFIDVGQISDPQPGLGSGQWLCDVGAQATLQVFGFGVSFSYGRDLRSGRNAVVARSR
jgi:tetratricopeptide (TPR) repeat protein